MVKSDLKQIEKLLDTKLEPVNQKLDSLTLDMIDVQKKTDVIADIHSILEDTKEKVEDHEQRLSSLESPA